MTRTNDSLNVGFVGAAAGYGWGRQAHVPAIAAVDGLTLYAVATSDQAGADASAASNGAVRGYGEWRDLIADPAVDIVSVAVRAPAHAEIVEAAIRAGKPVYCEWPLGRSLEETKHLASLARDRQVPTLIGLQGRASPWLRRLQRHLADGVVGEVLACTFVAQDELSTGRISASNEYMLDVSNGANPFTIHGGHWLDAIAMVLGEPISLSSTTALTRPDVEVEGTGRRVTSTAPDQTMLTGMFGGAATVLQVRAGPAFGRPVTLEFVGTSGLLRVHCDGFVHWKPMTFELVSPDGGSHMLDAPDLADDPFNRLDPAPAANVARHYADLVRMLRGGSAAPGFDHAEMRHRTLVEGC